MWGQIRQGISSIIKLLRSTEIKYQEWKTERVRSHLPLGGGAGAGRQARGLLYFPMPFSTLIFFNSVRIILSKEKQIFILRKSENWENASWKTVWDCITPFRETATTTIIRVLLEAWWRPSLRRGEDTALWGHKHRVNRKSLNELRKRKHLWFIRGPAPHWGSQWHEWWTCTPSSTTTAGDPPLPSALAHSPLTMRTPAAGTHRNVPCARTCPVHCTPLSH